MSEPHVLPEEKDIDPRTCTHPNLFGCDGHCVWCDVEVTRGPRLAYSRPIQEVVT